MPRVVSLEVTDDFSDTWLEHEATPQQRTALLRFVCALPRRVDVDTLADVRAAINTALQSEAIAEMTTLKQHNAQLRDQVAEARTLLDAERAFRSAQGAHDDAATELACRRAVEVARDADACAEASARAALQAARDEHADVERRLTAEVRGQLTTLVRATTECAELRRRVDELQTPAARGRIGEFAMAEAIAAAGFDVVDTSMGASKDEGHLDLLVRPHTDPSLRVAIEVKNRAKIDPKRDVDHFRAKVASGVARGLFDTAIFVSVRTHTKQGLAAHAVDTIDDTDGLPTIPVSFVGPERGTHTPPLSEEVLQSHVVLHTAFAARCRDIRAAVRPPAADDDEGLVPLLQRVRDDAIDTLEGMNAQSKAIASLQAVANEARVRSARQLATLAGHACAAYLRPLPPWVDDLRAASASGDVWKRLTEEQKKRVRDGLGGRDVFCKAARVGVDT